MSKKGILCIVLVMAALQLATIFCTEKIWYTEPTATRHPTYTVDYGAGSPTHQP